LTVVRRVVRGRRLPALGLAGRLGEEGFDNVFQFFTLTLGTLNFLGLVFFEREHFAEGVVALLADVFVEWHGVSWLGFTLRNSSAGGRTNPFWVRAGRVDR
jgi:hypothetical protein